MPRASLSIWARERAGIQIDKTTPPWLLVIRWVWLEPGQNRGNAEDEAEQIVKGLCARDSGAVGGTEGF